MRPRFDTRIVGDSHIRNSWQVTGIGGGFLLRTRPILAPDYGGTRPTFLSICAHLYSISAGLLLLARPHPKRDELSNDLVHGRRPEISPIERVRHVRIQQENVVGRK
jgi:hypothetical protein